MEEIKVQKSPTVIKYALLTAGTLIIYFLIMAVSGLIRYSALRVINYPLIAGGIILAIREIKSKNTNHRIGYLEGFGVGSMILLFTAFIFSAFVFIYARFINLSFINQIWDEPYSNEIDNNCVAIALYIFMETVLFGVILNLIVMQFFKRDSPSSSEEEQ